MELSELKLAFLGGLSVKRGEEPLVKLTSQKALALLCYLALTDQSHSRPALAGLLWGDMPESNALMNLRKALNQLRRQIGNHLLVTRQRVAFNRDAPHFIDVATLQDAANQIKEIDEIHSSLLIQVEQAVALYQGDFLEGFFVRGAPEFEQWVLGKRAYFRELGLQMMHVVASEHAKQGRYNLAIEFTRRVLRFEPWREEAHRDLMRLLAYEGQRGSALAQYETCRHLLQEELGVDPSEETQRLYHSIQADELRPPIPSPIHQLQVEPQRPAFLDEEGVGRDASKEPFVGREIQLLRLVEYLEASRIGQTKVAFVSAEAGWGKTSLLANFSCRAQEKYPDLIVANGICTTYTGTGDPYLPFREILRMLSGDIEGKWTAGTINRDHALRIWDILPFVVETLVTHGRNLVDTFVPSEVLFKGAATHESISSELTDQLTDLINRRQDVGVNQEHIFEEFTDVLAEISRKAPLLLILDDLHWADASSINLLFHLGRRLTNTPILILGAYRPEDVRLGREGKEHPLKSVLNEFKRLFGEIWVNLGQGRIEDDRKFVDALLDTELNRLSDYFREQLTRNTRGHPLFTAEMMREMRERGDVHQDDAGYWVDSPTITWDAIPGRVEGVIKNRVNRLAPQLREVLVTASVEGEEFTAEVIAQVRRIDEETMIRMLSMDLAKVHNLVRARGVEQLGDKRFSRYQFSHNLFQKYLYSTLDPVERVYQHEAIGKALERLHQGCTEEFAVHLARHFQEAGAIKKAIEYLKQAGEVAANVYANSEAIFHYSQAIHLAEQGNLSDEDLSFLYIRLGRLLELDSSFDRALGNYEKLASLANQRRNRAIELSSLMARVTILSVPTAVHDPKCARELGERALTLAGDLGDPASEAKILWSLSIANFFSNRLQEAIDCGERSLALARRDDLREQMAQTLNDLGGFIYLYSGRIDSAQDALQEASDLWRDLGNTPMLTDSLGGSCIAQVYAGDFERAVAYSEEAFQLSLSTKNLWGQSYSRWTIGDAFAERGEFSRAIEAMEECINLGAQANFLASQTYTPVRLAQIYMDLGALDKALHLVQEAHALSQEHLPPHAVQGLGVLARVQILMGNLLGAEVTLKEGRNNPYRESWGVFYLPVLLAEAELALHKGHPSKALSAADDLITRLRSYGMRLFLPEALYLQGKAFLGLGQDSTAYDRLLEAQMVAETIGSRRTSWRILFALSQLEKNPAKASLYLQEGREIVEFILAHLNTKHASLRETFLSQVDLQPIIEVD